MAGGPRRSCCAPLSRLLQPALLSPCMPTVSCDSLSVGWVPLSGSGMTRCPLRAADASFPLTLRYRSPTPLFLLSSLAALCSILLQARSCSSPSASGGLPGCLTNCSGGRLSVPWLPCAQSPCCSLSRSALAPLSLLPRTFAHARCSSSTACASPPPVCPPHLPAPLPPWSPHPSPVPPSPSASSAPPLPSVMLSGATPPSLPALLTPP